MDIIRFEERINVFKESPSPGTTMNEPDLVKISEMSPVLRRVTNLGLNS